MSSERQIEANRKNAQHSTGPRTPNGKARVTLNALKHGLTGKQVVLPGENPEDFEAFRTALLDELDPRGELEATLVEKLVVDAWRLRRVAVFEALLYRRHHLKLTIQDLRRDKLFERMGMSESNWQAYDDAERKLREPALALARRRSKSTAKPLGICADMRPRYPGVSSGRFMSSSGSRRSEPGVLFLRRR